MIGRADYAPRIVAVAAICVFLMAGCGADDNSAEGATIGSVTVRHAWLQSSVSGESPISAEIENAGPDSETLLDVISAACRGTVMHEVVDDHGAAVDREAASRLSIPSGTVSVLSPDSVHFSCQDPTLALSDGMTVDMTFVFEHAGEVAVVADVFD